VPQSAQKARRAASEDWNHFGSPRVQCPSWVVTKGPKKLPNAFWHMRHWHIEPRPTCLVENRTAPHWHPPVSSSAISSLREVVPDGVEHRVAFARQSGVPDAEDAEAFRLQPCVASGVRLLTMLAAV